MTNLPTIDIHAIENLRALSPDDHDQFLREIVTIFITDTLLRIRELEESLSSGDKATLVRAAHSIKGSAGNVGAVSLTNQAEKLERCSSKDGLEKVQELIERLKTEFVLAQTELEKLVLPND